MISVGIGEYIITNDKSEEIVTHALGSCVALIIHCPRTKYTALAHIVLPDELIEGDLLKRGKGYFAKQIVPEIVNEFLFKYNCDKRTLQVSLIGGASAQNERDLFKVGERNTAAIISVLNRYDLNEFSLDVGGYESRTVNIAVNTGLIKVKRQKMII